MFSQFSRVAVVAALCSLTVCFCSQPKGIWEASEILEVPELATEVWISSELEPEDYYASIRKELELMDIEVESNQAKDLKLRTEAVAIGRGLSLVIEVETYFDATYLTTISRFAGHIVDNQKWKNISAERRYAYWSSNNDGPAYAFRQLIDIVKRFDHVDLSYAVSQSYSDQ